MNSNGVLSLGGERFVQFQPERFPLERSQPPLVAPFWHDFNPSRDGSISYRETNQSDELIRVHRLLLGFDIQNVNIGFYPRQLFIATWNEVSPFNITEVNPTKLNYYLLL